MYRFEFLKQHCGLNHHYSDWIDKKFETKERDQAGLKALEDLRRIVIDFGTNEKTTFRDHSELKKEMHASGINMRNCQHKGSSRIILMRFPIQIPLGASLSLPKKGEQALSSQDMPGGIARSSPQDDRSKILSRERARSKCRSSGR